MVAYWESSLVWEAIASWIVMETVRIWFVYPIRDRRIAAVSFLNLILLLVVVLSDRPWMVWLNGILVYGIYRRIPYAITVVLLQRVLSKVAALLVNGSVYYGFCLIPATSQDWWLLCLFGLLWLGMLFSIRWQNGPWLRHAMMIRIEYQGKKRWYVGYWDSGNTIRYHNKPVIQICDERFRELSSIDTIRMMNQKVKVFPVILSGWHIPKQMVYAAYSEQMFFGCFEVLLNERMERVG